MSEPRDEYEELQGENNYLKSTLNYIAQIAKSVCIMPGICDETLRPIKNTSRKDVYRAMLRIQYYLDSVPVKNEVERIVKEYEEMFSEAIIKGFEEGFDEEIISK